MATSQAGQEELEIQSSASAGPSDLVVDNEATPNFSTSLSIWQEVNLPALQSSLENLCPTLIEAQKDALLSRKRLAEQTREFRKLNAENQAEAIKPLLKSYQSEIDSLTKRAKSAENAVLSVRDRLQKAVDPYPILETVLEQTANLADLTILREQIERLQSDNASLELQLKSLPALEAEKSRLANRIDQLESSMEARFNQSRKSIEAELSAKWDERIRNHQMREQDLTKTLELTQANLKEVRGNYAKVTERLLQHGEEIEREQTSGKIEELEMISEELSRSNERVNAMERRNEQLRQEIERLKTGRGEEDRGREIERRQQESEEENRRLAMLLEAESRKAIKAEEELARRKREADLHVREKDTEINTLRKRLQSMSDYGELKRELEIFKYVEFAAESDGFREDNSKDAAEDNDEDATSSSAKPLEALLIRKNRQLQDEVTNMRVAKTELEASTSPLRKELETAKSEVTRLKVLNERLEDDLIHLKPGSQSAPEAGKGMSAEEALAEMDAIAQNTEQRADGVTQPTTASPRQGPIPFDSAKAAKLGGSNGSTTPSASSQSILPIITSQRDRFRARNAELEEELRRQFETISELRAEVKTLQSDNLSLYEKVRYLQAYSSSSSSAQQQQNYRGPGGGSQIISVSARNAPASYPPGAGRGEDKYRDKYEAAMNPFEQFRGREQSRAMSSLNPLERILHMLTRLVLGHRRMRIFFVVYAISLHILVFALLFEIEFYSVLPTDHLRAVQPAVSG